MVAAASTTVASQPGAYKVGLCMTNVVGAAAIFDTVSGWIQVTN